MLLEEVKTRYNTRHKGEERKKEKLMQTIKTESVNWVMTRKTMHMSWQLGVEGMIIDDYDNDYDEKEMIRMICSSATF